MDIQLQPGRQLVRIPIYSETDERTQNLGLGTAEGMDQMLINMIPSKQPDGSYIADKRPGLTLHSVSTPLSALFSGAGTRGLDNICMTTLVDVCVGAWFDIGTSKILIVQYTPALGTATKIGEIPSATVNDWCFLTELMIGTTPTLGVIWTKADKSTSKGFYASSAAGVFPASSLTEITGAVDPDFPTNTPAKIVTGPFVQFKKCTYIMTTDGFIYNSDEGSITSWNTLGNTEAQAYPDKGVGLCRYKNFLVAFGEDSIEFFSWVNNPPPGSPLLPVDQAFIKFGCADPRLFRNVDDNLYWVSSGSGSTQGVWTLNNYTPYKITTRKQDNMIASAYGGVSGSPTSMFLRSIVLNGEQHLLITGIVVGAQLPYTSPLGTYDTDDPLYPGTTTHHTSMMCYNIQSKTIWYIADMADFANGSLYWLPCSYSPVPGGAVLNKWLNFVVKGCVANTNINCDNVYTVQGTNSYSSFTDYKGVASSTTASQRVAGIIQTPYFDMGSEHRKFIHKFTIMMDYLYQQAIAGYGDTKFYVFWSRDEYGNDSTKSFRRGFLLSNTKYRYYIKNLGSARRYLFCLWNQSNQPWRIKAIELELSQGVS